MLPGACPTHQQVSARSPRNYPLDLYRRGRNVFGAPTPEEFMSVGEQAGH
jgi:hypothetical protein